MLFLVFFPPQFSFQLQLLNPESIDFLFILYSSLLNLLIDLVSILQNLLSLFLQIQSLLFFVLKTPFSQRLSLMDLLQFDFLILSPCLFSLKSNFFHHDGFIDNIIVGGMPLTRFQFQNFCPVFDQTQLLISFFQLSYCRIVVHLGLFPILAHIQSLVEPSLPTLGIQFHHNDQFYSD